jgi:hypothetical protein
MRSDALFFMKTDALFFVKTRVARILQYMIEL